MMKPSKIILLVVIALALVFSGCKKKTGSVTIQVKARYNGQNVALDGYNDTTVFTSNGMLLQFNALKFYLAHITLVGTDGSTNEVSAAQLFDLSTPATLSVTFNNLKGDYKGIQFGCGLDTLLDNTDPNAVAPSNQLSAATCGDMYWSMQKYRFEALDGKWNYTTDPPGIWLHGFSYHVGGPGLYRAPVVLSKDFSITGGNTTTLIVYLDIQKIFNGSETIDIPSEGQTQTLSSDNPVIAPTFSDNFSHAFTF